MSNTPSTSRHNAGFWLIALTFLSAMAFSTIPAPLYPLYEKRDGFGSFTVTIVFAAYAVGVVASLLLAGHVSDWVGRKRVLVVAIATEVVAAIIFLAWPALPGLIVARIVTGLGVGMVTATATAYLSELHRVSRPDSSPLRFEIISTCANIGGLGVGPLVAGTLAQWAPHPLFLSYIVFLFVFALCFVAIVASPETVDIEHRPYHPQRVRVGDQLQAFAVAAAGGFASFSVLGLFTSLAPGFVAVNLHHPSRFLAGVVVFLVFSSAVAAQVASSPLSANARTYAGLSAEAVGLIILTVGMHATNFAGFLIGGAIAGAGVGMLFKSSVGTIIRIAPPAARGETLAGLFLISYLGLTVPVVGIGIATRSVSSVTATTYFSAILIAVLAAVAIMGRRVNKPTAG